MELNKELYSSILAALKVPEKSTQRDAGHEARRSVRLDADVELEIASHGVARSVLRKVRLRSISQTGVAVLDSFAMQAGDRFVIHLPREQGGTVPVLCTVRNSRWAGKTFRTGAEFTSAMECQVRGLSVGARGIEKTTEQAVTLTDPLGTQHRIDRVECNALATMWVYGEGDGRPLDVRVVDCSKGGICIAHSQPIAPGTRFLIKAPIQSGNCQLFCTAVNCRPFGEGTYRIGATFATGACAGLFYRLRHWFFRKSA